jgi:hypothetical protein
VKPGAFADLLLVDGDPIANIKLVEDPGKNFVVIMKDGKIYKKHLEMNRTFRRRSFSLRQKGSMFRLSQHE